MGRLLTAALALAFTAGPAAAQTAPNADVQAAVADGHAEWTVRVSPKLVRALGSTSTAVRAQALHAIGTLDINTPGGADLRPAIPALFDVLRTSADWRHQVMALRLLHASDDGAVMETLRDETTRPAPAAVQRLLLACLAEHYGVDALRYDARAVALAQALADHDRRRYRPSDRNSLIVAAK